LLRRSGRANRPRIGARPLLVALLLAWPLGLAANPGSRVMTGTEIVSDPKALTPDERRELASRRAAVETRVEELGRRLIHPCTNLRKAVQETLASVERVGAVDPGPALLTSDPPKLRVSYVVALTSGRRVRDEVIVVIPLAVRVVPAGGEAGGGRQCGRAAPG
jgi:hypothetical protein